MASAANQHPRKKVAIVGGGSAGVAALWALNRTPHDVYIYEASGRLGGYMSTVEYSQGRYKTLVDVGLPTFNAATSPNFIAFLNAIKQPTVPADMTFSVSRDGGSFQWATASLSSVFAQWKNIPCPKMWRMIFDIVRFNQLVLDLLMEEDEEESEIKVNGNHVSPSRKGESVEDFLRRGAYSDAFRDDYLAPLIATLWGTTADKLPLGFPMATLARLLWDHDLLSPMSAPPQWLTLKNGSKSYIDAVMRGFPSNHIFLNTPVKSIAENADGRVQLHLRNGKTEIYDHVIIATPGDEAYKLTQEDSSPEERAILSGFRTCKTTAVLHSDTSLMPKQHGAWTSCNYITEPSPSSCSIRKNSLTYNMNILQHIPKDTFGDVLVTLNPIRPPEASKIQGHYTYEQPLYNYSIIRARRFLPRIQNTRGISYCGAWTEYGFQEDGISSGLRVAQDHLGAVLPFELKNSACVRRDRPSLGIRDLLLRIGILIILVGMIFWEHILEVLSRGPMAKVKIKKIQWNGYPSKIEN